MDDRAGRADLDWGRLGGGAAVRAPALLHAPVDQAVRERHHLALRWAEMVHDLRQPIDALAIYAQLLAQEPARGAELAPRMLAAARSAQMLLAAQATAPEAWPERVVRTPVALQPLLGELRDQYQGVAQQRGLSLRARVPALVLGSDAVLLRRILGNLLANAIAHTRRGGVLLCARRRGDGVVFEVWDTGAGIDALQLTRIFEPGVRLAGAERHDGNGLGLAIVERLCRALGYRIEVRSRPGRGSVFRVLTGSSAGRACAHDAAPVSGS